MSLFLGGRNTKLKREFLGAAKLSEHHQGQLDTEGLIPIAMAVAFPDFLLSHRQSRPRTIIRSLISSRQQISARKVQSIALLFCRRPSLSSGIKPRPWTWKSTPPSSNRTAPYRISLDTSTSAISLLHESRRKSTL
jgi:hypothetical protein